MIVVVVVVSISVSVSVLALALVLVVVLERLENAPHGSCVHDTMICLVSLVLSLSLLLL